MDGRYGEPVPEIASRGEDQCGAAEHKYIDRGIQYGCAVQSWPEHGDAVGDAADANALLERGHRTDLELYSGQSDRELAEHEREYNWRQDRSDADLSDRRPARMEQDHVQAGRPEPGSRSHDMVTVPGRLRRPQGPRHHP